MQDYILKDTEYNLAKMEIQHIIRVKAMFPEKSLTFLAAAMKISKSTLEKKLTHYQLRLPVTDTKSNKKEIPIER